MNMKNLGGKFGRKRIGRKEKYPDKTSLNLVIKEKEYTEPPFQIAIFVIFLVILAVFVKFMIIDLAADSIKAQNQYETMSSQIATLHNSNVNYEKIRKEYSKYGNGYLNDEERAEIDRSTVMSVINDNITSKATITGIDISANVAKVTLDGVSLKIVSGIVSKLEDESAVSFVNVSTAGSTGSNSTVTATLSVNFKTAGGND